MTDAGLLFWSLLGGGFTLSAVEGKLIVQPRNRLSEGQVDEVIRHKAALLAKVRSLGGGPVAIPEPSLGWAAYYGGLKAWPTGTVGGRQKGGAA